jgi:nucleoside-diphosphate-sugar epimerase
MTRVLVFGHGAVGRAVTARLAARGDSVSVAQRRPPAALRAGVRFIACDLTEQAQTLAACAGQEVVICAAGFPYDSRIWARAWPAAMSAMLAGCEHAGARFVFADNLYMHGPQTGADPAPLREDMALGDFGRKPRIRAQITRLWQAAHDAGRVRAVAVRAADFYGPDVQNSLLSTLGVARLVAGRTAMVLGNADLPHDVTYVPDFARAVVALADAPDDAYGQAWNVPNAPTQTPRALLALAARLAGVRLRLQVVPSWLFPLLGLIRRDAYELAEMRFQIDRPYRVDSSKFRASFGMEPTAFEEGLGATVDFYRQQAIPG